MFSRKTAIVCAAAAALSFSGASLFAATVDVTPGNMGDWAFMTYGPDPTYTVGGGNATAEMVNGPATPPLGTGSAHLDTGSDGSQAAAIRLSNWAGTEISSLTTLGYSTYATSWNGSQLPYLTIWLSNGDRLWFEPTYSRALAGNGNLSPQADPTLNTWQTWDAINGMWYTDYNAAGSGPGSNAKTWSAIVAAEGTGVTITDPGGLGGIRIASGFASAGDHFDANLDNFSIGTSAGATTYNFEAVPEPGAVGLLGIGAAALLMRRRRRA